MDTGHDFYELALWMTGHSQQEVQQWMIISQVAQAAISKFGLFRKRHRGHLTATKSHDMVRCI